MSISKGRDAATASAVNGARGSWRDHLPIHPAAELFPLMSESELRELGEDIKKNGLQERIALYDGKLLDGRNRMDAMELVGLAFDWRNIDQMPFRNLCAHHDPYDWVIGANAHRRHLTSEQKRELIAKVLKAKPGESNRKIAKQTKADHKTVAAVRGELESGGEIPQLEKTTGADGKQYKSRSNKKAPESIGSKSSEISVEQRKAHHAALDPVPTEEEADEDWQINLFDQACLLLEQMADATRQLVTARGIADLLDIIKVRHESGGTSLIALKSYLSGREKFQGETLDWIWFDEEPPADIYTEGLTRTNVGNGPVWMTFTPLQGVSEVVRRFLHERSPDRQVVSMTIDDVDHYAEDEKRRIIASYPEHEKEARVKGIPVLGSGRIFPIAEERIAIEHRDIPPHWPRIGGMDFGWDRPFAAIRAGLGPRCRCDLCDQSLSHQRNNAGHSRRSTAKLGQGASLGLAARRKARNLRRRRHCPRRTI